MRKKIAAGLGIVLFSIFALINSAFAFGGFDEIYTVGSEGSTISQSSFGWNEQPWLYLKLPDFGLNVTGSWWTNPSEEYSFFEGSGPDENGEIWLTLKDYWDEVKEPGLWNISAVYFYADNPDNPMGSGSTSFTVTPEPLSSILFLAGASLMFLIYRKRCRSLMSS